MQYVMSLPCPHLGLDMDMVSMLNVKIFVFSLNVDTDFTCCLLWIWNDMLAYIEYNIKNISHIKQNTSWASLLYTKMTPRTAQNILGNQWVFLGEWSKVSHARVINYENLHKSEKQYLWWTFKTMDDFTNLTKSQ